MNIPAPVVTLFLLLLVPGTAAALGSTQPPGGSVEPAASSAPAAPSTPEQKKAAKKDLAAGQKLLKQRSFEEALTKLEAAYAVDPKTETLLGIAEAQKATDHLVEAYRSYDKALRDGAAEDGSGAACRARARWPT